MKVLVTGSNGQLGHDVIKEFNNRNIICKGVDKETLDITNEKDLKKYIERYNPDVVIHCAAYTAVDLAEDDKDTCYRVNVLGTKYISEVCRKINAKLIYISTDYVFDGNGIIPFEVTDDLNPINYYGKTKYEGEKFVISNVKKHYILRISWVFGINGNNFVKTMIKLSELKDSITVIDDQIGSPTSTKDLSKLIFDMAKSEHYGTYHATNEGYCSWYEFAKEIFNIMNINVKILPTTTKEYLTKANRPLNSRLSKKSLDAVGFKRLPSWQDSLKQYLQTMNKVERGKND